MISRAPGKIIISGEYSTIFGKPAVVMAVDRYVETVICAAKSKNISFHLLNFDEYFDLGLRTMETLACKLKDKYKQFLLGRSSISEVLKTPFQLAQFAMANLLDFLKIKPPSGVTIKTRSTIPVGCGMGSSAAAALSIMQAVANYLGTCLQTQDYLHLGNQVERLQHGHPSGVDVYTSLHGGCINFTHETIDPIKSPDFPMFVVNTGKPISSTGECVSFVLQKFHKHDGIWDEFAHLTDCIKQQLYVSKGSDLHEYIKENHYLLSIIGVVPAKVQKFITELHGIGAAAKICGAGSIKGEQGGFVLILGDDKEAIQGICNNYNYILEELHCEQHGLRLV